MSDFEKICDFQNLYAAHRKARLGKRDTSEVIEFELSLGENLTRLSDEIRSKTYRISGYYSFLVHDPKERCIHALHYRDRVVQHCICDCILEPLFERRLIYDNAACRKGKGTSFALERLTGFFRDYYKHYGADGYLLKCDIRKFFDHIDHEILKEKLQRVILDKDILEILYSIIDSYCTTEGKGLPLGNQTSQWFAIYYLDGFDRLIKEELRIRYYSRYMDDCILIYPDKVYLAHCRVRMEQYLSEKLKLSFNDKTQITTIRNGAPYLGWHFTLSSSGKVVRKVRQATKKKCRRKLKHMRAGVAEGYIDKKDLWQVESSYLGHLSYGETGSLRYKLFGNEKTRKL